MTTISINPAPRFDAPVMLSIPGTEKRAKLVFTFKHMGRRALRVWVERIGAAREADDGADVDMLLEVVEGWPEGPRADDGSKVEFSRQAFADLIEAYPSCPIEIFQAYLGQLAWARAKN